jgi:hypothetical protein
MIAIPIFICGGVAYLVLRWMLAPIVNDGTPRIRTYTCCDMVPIEDIEAPRGGTVRSELKRMYLEAEEDLCDAHDAIMADSIRASLADSLRQGWPLDVGVAQACYSFGRGICHCPTCKSLTEARQ